MNENMPYWHKSLPLVCILKTSLFLFIDTNGSKKQPVFKYMLRKKAIDNLLRICALFYATEM